MAVPRCVPLLTSTASEAATVPREFLLQLSFFLLLALTAEATPVRGLLSCLNHEDCVGANRYCHRNRTMTSGVCACNPGYKQARDSAVKCLSVAEHECHSDLDCPKGISCLEPLGVIDQFSLSYELRYPQGSKKCYILAFDNGIEPRTGGGLVARPGGEHVLSGSEFLDHYYTFGRRNRMNAGFHHPHYIKFVEDAMLVLFLLCVLVTLMVVHRASCYRQFRNSRRNGHLRYIIPHRDDQPPPYSQYMPAAVAAGSATGAPATTANAAGGSAAAGLLGSGNNNGGAVSSSITDPTVRANAGPSATAAAASLSTSGTTANKDVSSSGGSRMETPPPTYDEALVISQTTNTPLPLYIALPRGANNAPQNV